LEIADFAMRLVRVASPSVLITAAACGGTTGPGQGGQPLDGTGGSATDAASGTGGTTSTGGALNTGGTSLPLPTYSGPDGGGYPHCSGSGSALAGPCCVSVHCIEPPPGAGACPPLPAVTSQDLGYGTLGSGTCGCAPIAGPFDAESAQPYSSTQGPCCYTIGTNWCTGRPFVVAGQLRLAPLVRGAGWA
jgi:hypothetical protein